MSVHPVCVAVGAWFCAQGGLCLRRSKTQHSHLSCSTFLHLAACTC